MSMSHPGVHRAPWSIGVPPDVRHRRPVLWAALALFAAGGLFACVPQLEFPRDANVACSSNADCPDTFVCDVVASRCVVSDRPEATLEVPASGNTRHTVRMPFTLVVRSADSEIPFEALFEYGVVESGGTVGTWHPLRLTPDSPEPTGIAGSINGIPHHFAWDLLQDALLSKDLSLAYVATSADGAVSTPVVADATVSIRAQIFNLDEGLVSSVVQSPPIAIGNEAPRAEVVAATGESGTISVVLALSDTSGDRCQVELQFLGPDGEWRPAALSFGNTDALNCSAGTPEHITLGWNSIAPYVAPSDGTPQGVGRASFPRPGDSFRVQLRARAIDNADRDGDASHYGPFGGALMLTRLTNQSAPQIISVQAERATNVEGLAPIAIRYLLADAQSDPVDVTFEYQHNQNGVWAPCREYADIFGEGTKDLATSPLNFDGSGGMEHVFIWDPSATSLELVTSTTLRITVTENESGQSSQSIVPLARPAGRSATDQPVVTSGVAFELSPGVGGDNLSNINDIAAADFNRDGYLELVVAREGAVTTTIIVGASLASSSWNESFLPGESMRVAVGDFDGDGHLDIASGNNAGELRLFLGDGDFNFTLELIHASGVPGSLTAVDIDYDGCDDLIFSEGGPSYEDRIVQIYKGCSGAFLLEPGDILGQSLFRDVVAVDLDVDGDLDLVTANEYGMEVFRNDGHGSFVIAGTNPLGTSYGRGGLHAADLNQDGLPDLLVLSNTYAVLFTQPNDGVEEFTFVTQAPRGQSYLHGRAVDLDHNGVIDLVYYDNSQIMLALGRWQEHDQTFVFLPGIALEEPPPAYLQVVDIDRDGFHDLVVGHMQPARISILELAGAGAPRPVTFRSGPSFSGMGSYSLNHFDDDRFLDLLTLPSNIFQLWQGVGSLGVAQGTFSLSFATPFEFPSSYLHETLLVSARINDDGLHVAFLSYDSPTLVSRVAWSSNFPSGGVQVGRFHPPSWLVVDEGDTYTLNDAALGDLNDDGYDDLVLLMENRHNATGYIWTVFNEGPAAESSYAEVSNEVYSPLSSIALDVRVVDVDGDGYLDLVYLDDFATLHVQLSSGSPVNPAYGYLSNMSHTLSTLLGYPRAWDVGDIDNDGYVDIVVSSMGRVSTLYSASVGSSWSGFGPEHSHDVPANAHAVHLVDLNEDGFLDILAGGEHEGGYILHQRIERGASGRLFYPPTNLDLPGEPKNITLADINCDGVTDILHDHKSQGSRVEFGNRQNLFAALHVYWSERPAPSPSLTPINFAPSTSSHSWHRVTQVPCALAEDLRMSIAQAGKVDSSLNVPLPNRKLSAAWRLGDMERYVQTVVDGETRLMRTERFGVPLDLNADPPRGILASLPLYGPAPLSVPAANLRVYHLRQGYTSAASVASDPLHGHPDAHKLLAVATTAVGRFEVSKVEYTWERLPEDADGLPETGAGRRYIYDPDAGEVNIITDEGGIFQVLEAL